MLPLREHQDPFRAQRRELSPEVVVERGRLRRIEAQLNDRHVGARIHQAQHAPGAVIQAASVIETHLGALNQVHDAVGELRVAREREY